MRRSVATVLMLLTAPATAGAGGSYATVVVRKPDRRNRAIFFRMGRPLGADTSQADG